MRVERWAVRPGAIAPGAVLLAGLVTEVSATIAVTDGATAIEVAWNALADLIVVTGIVLAVRSVRRLRAEQDRSSHAASLEHERASAVLESSPFGVAELLIDGTPRLVAVNRRFAMLTGMSRRRLLDSDPRLLLTAAERRRVHRFLREAIRAVPGPAPRVFHIEERGLAVTLVPMVVPEGPLRLLVLLFPARATGAGGAEVDVSPCVFASDLRRQLATAAGFADLLLVDPTVAASGVHDVTSLVRLLDGAASSLDALVRTLDERHPRAA